MVTSSRPPSAWRSAAEATGSLGRRARAARQFARGELAVEGLAEARGAAVPLVGLLGAAGRLVRAAQPVGGAALGDVGRHAVIERLEVLLRLGRALEMAERNPAGEELGLGEGHAPGEAVRHGDGVGVGGAAGGQQVARELAALVPPGVVLVGDRPGQQGLGVVEAAGAAHPLGALQLYRRLVEPRRRDAAQHRRRIGRARGHRQPRVGDGLVVGRQLGQQVARHLRAAVAQDAVEAGDVVLRREKLAVAVQEVVLVGAAERRVLPAVARELLDVAGTRRLGGLEAAHVAGAGERRKGGEVADDVAGRRFRADAVLRLPAQHLGLGPVGIVAQEAPGRGEVGIGLGRGPQDVPVDVARQQRIAEVRHHRAGIAVAALVDRLERGGKGGGLGVAERLGRGDGLRHVALRRRRQDAARRAVIADRQRRAARSGLRRWRWR